MRTEVPGGSNIEEGPHGTEQGDTPGFDSDGEDEYGGVDWVVFLVRASALIIFGATLVTSFDLSLNQGADWLTVMRLAMLPFAGGVLLVAAAELVDRSGD